MQYIVTIGLEVHVQLNTESKLFSSSPTRYGQPPNTQTNVVDLALPGTLPVLNKAAVEKAIRFGLAIHAKIPENTIFSRKNYFYPDLPKGYQTSQDTHPIVGPGELEIEDSNGGKKTIQITRAHLEEDAGKLDHESHPSASEIDLNRAGVPLLEIVTEPCIESPEQAVATMKAIHSLVKCLGISDGNLEKGEMRCDANISLREKQSDPLGKRVEIKNINSFKFIGKALSYEIKRQTQILLQKKQVDQETRLYNASQNTTFPMRQKEDAHDYRYFPCPDLPILRITPNEIKQIQESLPELPWEKRARFEQDYQLTKYDATLLASDFDMANFFESILSLTPMQPKLVANWLNGPLCALLNKHRTEACNIPIPTQSFSDLLNALNQEKISGPSAKVLLEHLWQNPDKTVDALIESLQLVQVTDPNAIESMVKTVLTQFPKQHQAYLDGKDKLFGFFVGQVMKVSKGQASPQLINQLLKKLLLEIKP
jgi:aspartyl-tRNA(Asn)/glutamyl-tRNA(Gln) amidotransferase subunit B